MLARVRDSRKFAFTMMAIVTAIMCGCFSIYMTMTKGIGDSDFYWHISLGKEVLSSMKIPEQDVFSWLSMKKGYVETAHSWLGSVIIYLFSRITSNPITGGILFNLISYSVLAYLIIRWYGYPFPQHNSKNDFLNAITGIAAGMTVAIAPTTVRPLTFGLILFLVAMKILQETYQNPDYKGAFALPVVSLLWANLHGGSVPILFAFNGLFLAMSILPKFNLEGITEPVGYSKKRFHRMLQLTVADVVAALANPYGYKLFIYFFITNNETTKKYVGEWQGIALGSIIVVSALILMCLLIVWKKSRIRVSYLLPVMCTLVMSAKYCRIQSYLAICATMLVADTLRQSLPDTWEPKVLEGADMKKLWIFMSLCACVAFGAAAIEVPAFAKNREKNGDKISPDMLVAIESISPERMYNGYNSGGYLIYHGYQSFIDSRADPFDSKVLEKALLFESLNIKNAEEAQKYMEEYDFDAMFVESTSALRTYLELHPDWDLYFEDNNYALFIPA